MLYFHIKRHINTPAGWVILSVKTCLPPFQRHLHFTTCAFSNPTFIPFSVYSSKVLGRHLHSFSPLLVCRAPKPGGKPSPKLRRRKGVTLAQAVYLKGPAGSRLPSTPQHGCHLTMYLFTHLAKNFSYRPRSRFQAEHRETCM